MIEVRLRTMRILWAALIGSVGMLGVMLHVIGAPAERGAMPPHMDVMLGAFSVGVGIMSLAFPARLFAMTVRNAKLDIESRPGEARPERGDVRQPLPTDRVFVDPELARGRAMGLWQQPLLIGMALAESIALMGFMLGFVGESMPVASAFFVAALVLMLLRYPRLSAIERALEQAANARLG